jgi:hypothetical protein
MKVAGNGELEDGGGLRDQKTIEIFHRFMDN